MYSGLYLFNTTQVHHRKETVMTEEIREEEKNLRPGNIQDVFLNNARKNRSPIIVYLISGFQMRGIVKSFDNYVILLESEGKQSMIYKHAVSTISPL